MIPALTLVSLLFATNAWALEQAQVSRVVLPQYSPCFGKPLAKDLISFSIEMDRWSTWAGEAVGSPNKFTNQVLTNLGERTGRQPSVRVGANSEDNGQIDLSFQVQNSTFLPGDETNRFPEATSIKIGKDFYRISSNLPKGTTFTWGINLKDLNTTDTVAQAELLYDTWYGSRASLMADHPLEWLEIGNEPDFGSWAADPLNYTTRWSDMAQAVDKAVDFGAHPTRLQIAAFVALLPNTWNAANLLGSDILATPPGKYAKRYSSHKYSGANGSKPQPKTGDLFNKDTIRGNLSYTGRDAMFAHQAGLEFVLGETNSYARHGVYGVSNGGESAIWLIDYALQAASLGVDRLYFHHGVGFAYSMFAPIAGVDDGVDIQSRPHILPSYYGALLTAEFIGSEEGNVIGEVSVNSTSVSSYGVWSRDGELLRVAIVNSDVYLAGDSTQKGSERKSMTIDLYGTKGYSKKNGFTLKRLAIPSTTAHAGITWAGQNFDTENGIPSGSLVHETYTGTSFAMNATEAVLITFK